MRSILLLHALLSLLAAGVSLAGSDVPKVTISGQLDPQIELFGAQATYHHNKGADVVWLKVERRRDGAFEVAAPRFKIKGWLWPKVAYLSRIMFKGTIQGWNPSAGPVDIADFVPESALATTRDAYGQKWFGDHHFELTREISASLAGIPDPKAENLIAVEKIDVRSINPQDPEGWSLTPTVMLPDGDSPVEIRGVKFTVAPDAVVARAPVHSFSSPRRDMLEYYERLAREHIPGRHPYKFKAR